MPTYEYAHGEHRTTRFRPMSQRHDPVTCDCGEPMALIISGAHVPIDGVYSYAPNIGSADTFERRRAEMKDHGRWAEQRNRTY